MLVDSHAHITKENYENIEEILNEANKNGINKIINAGDNLDSSKEVISLSKQYDNVLFCAVGIHPEYADSIKEKDLIEIENLIKNNKVIAVGEIGLDYYYGKENKLKQIELFEKELSLAVKYHLPVVVHSRSAVEDTINTLKKYKLKGVIHCFNGSTEIAKGYIKLGYKLGIGGLLTFKNCKLIEVLKEKGIENIVLETDSPYLTPEPFRKYKNEPKYIKNIAEFLSKELGIEIEKLEYITNKNISEIFDI